MEVKIVKIARRRIILILVLSIICLFLISFLPWISVEEDGMLKENLHFNYEMMRESNNEEIYELSVDLMNINILFLTIIVVSLLSFIFITYHALVRSSLFSQILIVTSGCITFVISFLIVYFQVIFSRLINDIDFISASMIQSSFAYAYIQFILSIILLIISGLYTLTLIRFSIKQIKKQSIQKRKNLEIYEEDISDISEENIPEKSLKESDKLRNIIESERDFKFAEIDRLLAKKQPNKEPQPQVEKENIQEQDLEKDIQIDTSPDTETIEVEEEIQEKKDQQIETIPKEEEKIKHPFPLEKPKKKPEKTDELHLSNHFEKVLSSAIEKKQLKNKPKDSKETIKKQEKTVEPKQEEKKDKKSETIFQTEKILLEKKGDKITKIFNLKCPDCNHIFPFEKKEDNQKIKCPKCGKEGTTEKKY